MQPPIAALLRSHPNSLYMPCKSPECWPDKSNLSVQVGPEGLSNLGSPQHPLSLFIRDTALQQKQIAGKEGEKSLHTRKGLLSTLICSESILASTPKGQHMELLAFTRLDSLKIPVPWGCSAPSLSGICVFYHHPCQLCFYQLCHSSPHREAGSHRDTVPCFPMGLALTSTTGLEKPSLASVHMPSKILYTLRQRIWTDLLL